MWVSWLSIEYFTINMPDGYWSMLLAIVQSILDQHNRPLSESTRHRRTPTRLMILPYIHTFIHSFIHSFIYSFVPLLSSPLLMTIDIFIGHRLVWCRWFRAMVKHDVKSHNALTWHACGESDLGGSHQIVSPNVVTNCPSLYTLFIICHFFFRIQPYYPMYGLW